MLTFKNAMFSFKIKKITDFYSFLEVAKTLHICKKNIQGGDLMNREPRLDMTLYIYGFLLARKPADSPQARAIRPANTTGEEHRNSNWNDLALKTLIKIVINRTGGRSGARKICKVIKTIS